MVDKYRGDVDALTQWAKREYDDALASRYDYDMLLDLWTRQYEGQPKVAQRQNPWPGASNMEVNESASHTDAVFSRIEQAWFATDPFARFNYFDEAFKQPVYALQRFINEVTLKNANYRVETPHALLGMSKFGTSFQWCGYVSENYQYWRNNTKIIQSIHEGPLHKYLSPRQVIWPADARDIQKSRWLAIRSYYTWGELVHQANLNIFEKSQLEQIRDKGRTINNKANTENERETGIRRVGQLLQWEIVQMFARYYNERANNLEEVWLTFDYPSMIPLQCMYVPYDHLMRPLTKYVYMIREGAFAGLGIVGMMSSIQEEISTIHNYTIDAMLFSNAPMIVGPKNMQNEIVVHPGAYLPYVTKKDEFDVFQAGMVHASAFQAEASARMLGERRTGIGDGSMQRIGGMTGGTNIRTPVGTTMALLGETNRRFNMSISLGKESERMLLLQHVMLVKQFWPEMKPIAYKWNRRLATQIDRIMSLSDDVFKQGVGVELSMSTQTLNKEQEKRNIMELAAFMREYYLAYMQLMTQLKQFPQLERELREVLTSMEELATRILQTYDIRNIDEVLPNADDRGISSSNPSSTDSVVDGFVDEFLTRGRTGITGDDTSPGSDGASLAAIEAAYNA